MKDASAILAGFVALLHIGFGIIEMAFWNTERIRKVFDMTETFARDSRWIAQNMGLYNWFLAAGLGWSLFAPPSLAFWQRLFFSGCIAIAGVVGAITRAKKLLILQTLFAIATGIVTYLAGP